IFGEPAQLFLKFRWRQSFGPMDHEAIEPGIFRLDRLDPVDHFGRRAAKPRLLSNSIPQRRRAGTCAGRTPGAPLLVGVTHKAEWREPFESLVMRRLEPPYRLVAALGQINAGAPNHVLAELLILAALLTGSVVSANDIVQDFLAVKRDHGFETVLRHELNGFAAGDRHPNLDR